MSPPATNPLAAIAARIAARIRAIVIARLRTARKGTKALGDRGERLAARHLKSLGYRVVARNLVLGNAEADLVCLSPDRRTIVIVEVKSRRTTAPSHGGSTPTTARTPEAAITVHKRAKLRQLARSLGARRAWAMLPVRIDVIAIDVQSVGQPTIRHHVDAVR